MSYVIAAYLISIGAVVAYFAHLVHERRRLLRELSQSSS
jgi:heme exporter protein D